VLGDGEEWLYLLAGLAWSVERSGAFAAHTLYALTLNALMSIADHHVRNARPTVGLTPEHAQNALEALPGGGRAGPEENLFGRC
jgi:hypothetical protein